MTTKEMIDKSRELEQTIESEEQEKEQNQSSTKP